MLGMRAARAYQASSARRSLREQEADVFHRVVAGLRSARSGSSMAQVKALADTGLLWSTLIDLMRDPANAMPPPLRGSVISVGLAVQREVAGATPDFGFLIGVTEQIAAGLMDQS